MIYKVIVIFFLSLIIVSFTYNKSEAGVRCYKKAVILKSTFIYKNLPRLSTKRGLIGKSLGFIEKGTRILVCKLRYVRIGYRSIAFALIIFKTRNGIKRGWIFNGTFMLTENLNGTKIMNVAFSPSEPVLEDIVVEDKDVVINVGGAGGFYYDLYITLFTCLIAGMLGKILLMWVDGRLPMKAIARRSIAAFIFAPMAFLGVLQMDIEVKNQKDLIFFMVSAFNSGYFFSDITSFRRNGKNGNT